MEKISLAANGIKIYSYKNPALHGFFISLFLRAGSMYESAENNGITHFLEHVSIRNVNKLMNGTLYSTLDATGLDLNASTYSEMVQFYVGGASEHFRLGAELIARLLSPLVLSRAEIDAERKRIKAEIRENDDKSSLSSFAAAFVYEGTPLSRSIAGSNGSVDKISGKRLEEYRKSVFTPDNVFAYVTGNFSERDIEALAAELAKYPLGGGERHENLAPVPAAFMKREACVHIKSADFTKLRFSFDIDMAKTSLPETDILYDVLFSGYSAWFYMEMSEKRGMCYDVSGSLERYRNIGEFVFTYEVREADVYDSIAIAVDILRRIKSELLPESALMKAAYVDNAYTLYDDAREFNFTFAYDAHIMELTYRSVEDRIAAYRAVSPESVRRAARDIFRREALTLSVKGRKKKLDAARMSAILSAL